MTKIANGRAIDVPLASTDEVGDVVKIGMRICRILSKSSDTRGVVLMDGVVEVDKESGSSWSRFGNVYHQTSGDFTDDSSATGAMLAGIAAEGAPSAATRGKLLLNGLPAIDGD